MHDPDMTYILPSEIEATLDALRAVGKGELLARVVDNIKQAAHATMVEGKKSSVTITLEFKSNDQETIILEGDTKANIPRPKTKSTFFYNFQNKLIGRDRPNQSVLPGMERKGE